MSGKKRPAVWPVVVWPVLILVVTGALVTPVVSGFVKELTQEDQRMVAPGSMEVELEEAGSYHVWFYTRGVGEDGKMYDAAGPGPGSEDEVRVVELGTGSELAVTKDTMRTTKNLMEERAESAGVFVMGGPGKVRVTVEGGPERVVAVSRLDLVGASMKLGMGIVVGILGGVLAVVVLVVLLVVRARRVKLWERSVPPPVF